MSVSARTKQYGVMRAIGMDGSQLTRMVAAEAFTYAVSGLIVGCIAGDDTILCAVRSLDDTILVMEKIRKLI